MRISDFIKNNDLIIIFHQEMLKKNISMTISITSITYHVYPLNHLYNNNNRSGYKYSSSGQSKKPLIISFEVNVENDLKMKVWDIPVTDHLSLFIKEREKTLDNDYQS